MTFGEKLQKLRKVHGLSQEELASQITVSRQALSKWELGTAIPDTENVLQISRIFDVSLDYLLNDAYSDESYFRYGQTDRNVAKHTHKKRVSMIVGLCMTGVSALALLLIGILSSVFPAVYTLAAAGADWEHSYMGLLGFLKANALEWLFVLCIVVLASGILLAVCGRFCKSGKGERKSNHPEN